MISLKKILGIKESSYLVPETSAKKASESVKKTVKKKTKPVKKTVKKSKKVKSKKAGSKKR